MTAKTDRLSSGLEWVRGNGRIFLWLREGRADTHLAHVVFVANSQSEVDAAYAAAIAAGAAERHLILCDSIG
jgi:hypothetical protein